MSKTEEGLFHALEEELKKAQEPLDCATLYDRAAVRKHAASVNRVSDYLGHMWRKGQVTRIPAPKLEGTRARWLYVWKGRPKAQLVPGIDYDEHKGTKILTKPTMEITENGGVVTIELMNMTIVIKPKS